MIDGQLMQPHAHNYKARTQSANITRTKHTQAKPLEFSRGTKSLFAGLEAAAANNLPRAATYSDPFGGAKAQPLAGAFYRDGKVCLIDNVVTFSLCGVLNRCVCVCARF